MEFLIWINTMIILAVVIILVVTVFGITRALREIAQVLHRNDETLARIERLSIATLERVAANQPSRS